VRDLLEGLKREGTTILISSHQLSDIEEICDGIAIIHKGRNVASGGLDELLRSRDEYEITLEKPLQEYPEVLPDSATWTDSMQTRLQVDKVDLNQALKVLAERGAAISAVRQRRMTLEEYFLEQVGDRGWEVRG